MGPAWSDASDCLEAAAQHLDAAFDAHAAVGRGGVGSCRCGQQANCSGNFDQCRFHGNSWIVKRCLSLRARRFSRAGSRSRPPAPAASPAPPECRPRPRRAAMLRLAGQAQTPGWQGYTPCQRIATADNRRPGSNRRHRPHRPGRVWQTRQQAAGCAGSSCCHCTAMRQ